MPVLPANAAGRTGGFFYGALVFLLLLGNSAPVFSQSTGNVRVYVAPVRGGSAADRDYFSSNIRIELIGASYGVVETKEESDFYMILAVSRDSEARNRFLVNLTLYETATDREIITLGKDYTSLDEMNEWNLYLIYQAMANAPISKSVTGDEAAQAGSPAAGAWQSGTAWWNRWLWLGLEADLTYQYPEDGPGIQGRFEAELDFLSFMGLSAGFGYSILFPLVIDGSDNTYYHARTDHFLASAMLKFMFNGANYRIMPGAGAELNLGDLGILQPETSPAGLLSILGGLDFRLKAWGGALDLGARFMYALETESMGFGFSVSYRFGLFSRRAPTASSPAARQSAPPETAASPEAP
jgi:hypothetical protein